MASLVAEGSQAKKARVDGATVVIQLQSVDGTALGPQCNVPLDAGSSELEKLVNELKRATGDAAAAESSSRVPYAFYADGSVELTSLRAAVEGGKRSTEEVVVVTYEPLAVFRVRRVSRCAETMPGHTDAILHVSYSPDGKMLASGGGDATVRFWDALSATPKRTLAGHKNHVLATAWAPDASKFASGDKNGEVRVWDAKAMKCVHVFTKHTKWITSLAWAPLHVDGGSVDNVNFGSQLVASASKDASIKVWNARTGAMVASLTGHTDSVEAVAWAGDGALYSASRDRSIKVWAASDPADPRTYRLARTLQGHAHRINTLALSSAFVLRTGPFDHKSGSAAFKPPAAEDAGGEWPRVRAQALARFKAFEALAGHERLVSGSDDATLILWTNPLDPKAQPTRLTGHQQPVNMIAFSPDARKFASASFDKKVKLWHGRTGAFLATLTGHVAACYAVAWSPDSRLLISASRDSTLKVWHAADDERPPDAKQKAFGSRKFATALETLSGHHDEVFAVDWAPNGAHAASGSKDRTIKVWHS